MVLVLSGMAACSLRAAESKLDPVCGPEILTVADAWIKSLDEFKIVREQSAKFTSGLELHVTNLVSHMEFMRRRSVLLAASEKQGLELAVQALLKHAVLVSTALRNKDASSLPKLLSETEELLGRVKRCYPPAALEPGTSDALVMTGLPAPIARVIILDAKPRVGEETRVRFGLRTKSGRPIRSSDLLVHQEKLLHALLLDPSFTDYHHAHPIPLETPGDFEFVFTPKKASNYRMWINLLPLPIGAEEFPYVDLLPSPNIASPDRTTNAVVRDQAAIVGLHWISGAPRALRKAILEVRFQRPEGGSYCCLEPYMGSLGHMVGVSEDYRSILHLHPGSGDPKTVSGTNVSSLRFEMIVPRPGFARLFLQTQSAGELQLRSFGAQFDP